ncbi:hypothetical protein [Ralstonia pseudosolanacearum]|uniref:hypothetical protein n=1 Tax=Ralstonia pseudosolanacearum TaxID=1310165 RepID=UPI001FF9599C|nr:hypothetical protein [Ralstonia pseudosolanacearum]
MGTTIDLQDLLKSAVIAGVVAAFVNQGLVWIKEWAREAKALKLRRQHAALALAVALERYALACAHGVQAIRQGMADAAQYHNPDHLVTEVPDLVLPQAADAQCLPAALVARVLAVPLEIRYAQECVRAAVYEVDDFVAADVAIPKVGRLGWDAWNTAIALRSRQGLPDAELNIDFTAWDFRDCLRIAATARQ